ncbi:zinc-dependent peptidase [Mucilaginibacter sp. McL0603]|uniref:M90 family metallopeptidase n=1 Tax=Mucilaginibacter sp. McL0603 TaxID=3415670 RepID=UPI003CF59147
MSYLFIILLAAVLVYIIFFRKKVVKAAEIAGVNYDELLDVHVPFYRFLELNEKNRFEKRVREFFREVRIEGVGTEVTDVDRVLIAASAVIPIFGFPEWKYKNLTNVILYPDTFDGEFQFEGGNRNILGMVGSGYMNGQMLLSRAALVRGFSSAAGKENTAIHEFVHLLDKSDGATDGVPANLQPPAFAAPWLHLMHVEMRRISAGKSDINPYALTNEAEFFAVAAEYFFEKPRQLQQKHPELYASLSSIFGQDPADGGGR